MSVYVRNGTPIDGPSLCETCCNAHVQRGYRLSEEIVLCTANNPDRRVPFRVRECTSYIDKNRQSLYEMEQMAWILAPRGLKRAAGFVPQEQVRAIGREIELTLDDDDEQE
jgi:hypothetical protein